MAKSPFEFRKRKHPRDGCVECMYVYYEDHVLAWFSCLPEEGWAYSDEGDELFPTQHNLDWPLMIMFLNSCDKKAKAIHAPKSKGRRNNRAKGKV